MQPSGSATDRNVVPRWRPLARTPGQELRSAARKVVVPSVADEAAAAVAKWEITRSLADASDAIDAAILSGRRDLATAPAQQLSLKSSGAMPQVRLAARKVLGILLDGPTSILSAESEASRSEIRSAISRTKNYLIDAPRDAITTMEIARLYSLLGQVDKAEKFVRRATQLSPDNRYILRCCSRFFTFRGAAEDALKIIWKSDAVRSDPWVQAAEIAVADATKKNPKWGPKALKSLSPNVANSMAASELAAAVATLEFKHAAKRKEIRKLLEMSLRHPSENTIAQALWLEQKAGISVDASSCLGQGVAQANEAESFVAFEAGAYELAARQSRAWALDQPLQVRAFINNTSLNAVYLQNYNESLRMGKIAEIIHPNNWSVINGIFFSAALSGLSLEAYSYLKKLESFLGEPPAVPFIHAARGLVSYLTGDVSAGRENYLAAIRAAREIKKPDLVMNAYIYWLEQEAKAGTMSRAEFGSECIDFERMQTKLGADDKRNVSRLWAVRKPLIQNSVAEHQNRSKPFDRQVSQSVLEALPQVYHPNFAIDCT